MKNNKSGFAILSILLGVGLLLIGGGVGVMVVKKFDTTSSESAVMGAFQDTSKITPVESMENKEIIVDEKKEEGDVSAITVENDTSVSETFYASQSAGAGLNISEGGLNSLTNIQIEETRNNSIAYETAKEQLESLSVILDDARAIAENKKSVMKREVESCKQYYEYEVESIESRWESNLNYYESQKSYYESNSSLYSLVGTSGNNERYLEEDYERFKEERSGALKSAKSRYEDCKNNYVWDTSFDKDIESLTQEQRNIENQLTSDNASSYLSDVRNLISEAEKLKYSLMLVF